ncbi:MAG: PucR family transcriptional regulator [Acidobacteria bacterium]|nr:PucR family transcriptional regulator [Acidobacteriota bacterium]
MGLTLGEILELDVLQRGGARVVSGSSHLDREVRWVHVTELPDIAHLLQGGELLLTTGMGITSSVDMQRRYVTELVEAGVSGMVIELGRNFKTVPSAMVRAADKVGLPIIVLDRETRFVEITETVHREIISHQYEMLDRAERVSRELTELILNGAEAAQIVTRLAEIFDNHVILEDEAHQVIEIAGPASGIGELLSDWQMHSRNHHQESRSGSVHHSGRSPMCMWVEVWLRHNPWGRLHVIATNSRFEANSELLVDRAGAAIALSLLSEKDAAHMADRARAALVGEVIVGRSGSGAEFLRRARSLGSDLGDGPVIAVALEAMRASGKFNDSNLTEENRLHIRLNVADELRTSAHLLECAALVTLSGDRIIAVLASAKPRSLVELSEQIIDSAAERLARRNPPVTILAGTSQEVVADALHKGIEEATTALTFARHGGTERRVHNFLDLGTYQLLASLAQGPELAKFVEHELQALLDYDARVRAKLLPTLRAYLSNAGRKSEAGRSLGVQRRTLYARLAKIELILRRDLENQDTRTRLTLALQGLDLLEDRWK